jgi:hypothetical protein
LLLERQPVERPLGRFEPPVGLAIGLLDAGQHLLPLRLGFGAARLDKCFLAARQAAHCFFHPYDHTRQHTHTPHATTTRNSNSTGGRRARRLSVNSLLEHALEEFDLLRQIGVVLHHLLDLANRVEDGRVVATAEAAADLGQ